MIKKLLTILGISVSGMLVAQDFGIKEVIVYENLNPQTKASNDSILAGDTVAFAVKFHNFGSGLLGPNDSIGVGLSLNGTYYGSYGVRGIGVNLVPGFSEDIVVEDSITFTTVGTHRFCSWPEYTKLGGDPNKGNDTSCKMFTIYASTDVLVTSFSPTAGYQGTEVTVDGNNFDPTPSNNTVKLGSANVTVKSATLTKLVFDIPNGATTAPISVTTNGKTSTSSSSFEVNYPSITAFLPLQAKVGETIIFLVDQVISAPDVKFNGTSSGSVNHTGDTVTAVVPTGATSGFVEFDFQVTSVTSSDYFTVLDDKGNPLQIESIKGNTVFVWQFERTLYFSGVSELSELQIFDLRGKAQSMKEPVYTGEKDFEFDLNHLQPGIYLARWGDSHFKFSLR